MKAETEDVLTCPYHGWSFSNVGDLIAVSAEKDFGTIDKSDYGLMSLPVYESAGLIWAILNPNSESRYTSLFVWI